MGEEKQKEDVSHHISSSGKVTTINHSNGGDISKGEKGEVKGQTEDVEREVWGNWLDFLLACIGYAVGLGNVWRFPYLCYDNGGGAFLIPYIIMLLVCGLPLFFLEFSFGQFASMGALTIWEISPIFKGVGIGMVILSALVAIYYNVIIAWTVYYGIKSLTFPVLPWVKCDNEWNTPYCLDDYLNTSNALALENRNNSVRASQEFWNYKAHELSGRFGDFNGINWPMLACLLASWVVVCACISKGVKSSGKVVYFTAVFPYVVLVILFFRGVTLPGAWEGIKFYIIPDITKLFTVKPWKDAATQIFYSLGISFGGLMTFASYNKWHNNCHRDALIVAFTNCGTSIFAGFVIFSILGFMAFDSQQEVKDVVASGPGLAFIAYPEAVARMPGSQFWALLFFFMLFTLGLDSEFAMMETVITATMDELPAKYKKYKLWFTIGFCTIGFFLGIPMVTKSGIYLFTLFDWYSAGFSLMAIAIIYTLVINYLYGFSRFSKDLEAMLGFGPNIYWKGSWLVTAPLAMFVIMIFSFVFYVPAYYDDYVFPASAQVCGWIMSISSFIVIPAYMVYALFYVAKEGTISERLFALLRPTPFWGPLLNEHRSEAGYPPRPDDSTERIIVHSPEPAGGLTNIAFEQDVQIAVPATEMPPSYSNVALAADKSYM